MSRLAALRNDASSESGRNALWGMAAEVGQLVVSLGIFLGLALVLETSDFGLYSATVAMAMIMANFAHLGGHVLMIRRVARGEPLEPEWQRAVTTVVLGTLIGTVILLGFRTLFVPQVSARTFVLITLSQTTFFWLAESATQASQAMRRLVVGAKSKLTFASVRVISLVGFTIFGEGTLDSWAWWAIGGSAVGSLGSILITQKAFDLKTRFNPPTMSDVRMGLPFVLSATSDGVLDSIDRPLLTRYKFVEAAGFYSIAYRIATISVLPIMAMARATDASFFEKGARNPAEAYELAKRLTVRSAGYGFVVGLALFIIAPFLPEIISTVFWFAGDGEKFEDVATVLRYVAVLPLLRGIQMFPANALTGSDRHNIRLIIMVGAMLLNLLLNLYFIPRYSWKGAVGTTLGAETAFAIALWVAASRLRTAQPAPSDNKSVSTVA